MRDIVSFNFINKVTSIGINSVVEMTKTIIDTKSLSSTILSGANVIIQSVVCAGSDYTQRQLSEAESNRVALSIEHINNRISAQIANGKRINSEFVIDNGKGRKPSVEICEAVLQKCKAEYEEKKIPFISNIFAVAPFILEYSSEEVFYRIMLAEKLTYRQLCMLSMINNSSIIDTLKQTEYVSGHKDYKLRALLIEIMDLHRLGLIQNYDREVRRAYGISGILAIIPYNLSLTKDGERQVELMDLSTIKSNYLDEIIKMLL